jgi:glycosyltransferase involved in cell wall biosynthesis
MKGPLAVSWRPAVASPRQRVRTLRNLLGVSAAQKPLDDQRRRAPDRDEELSFASVLHINEKGGSFGGTEEYIALVTAELGRRGVQTSLVCGVVTGSLPPGLERVHVVPGLADRRSSAGTAADVAKLVAELDPDVIYVHNVFDADIVPAISALDGRGVVLWYVHDHYLTCLTELRLRGDVGSCPHRLGSDCLAAIDAGHCVKRHPTQSYVGDDVRRRAALSRSLGAADAVIVVSDYMRTLLLDAEPALDADMHTLTRPIRDVGAPRTRPRIAAHDPAVVAYAGRINAEKGLDVVIAALGAATTSAPVELRIAGVVEDEGYWFKCQQLIDEARTTNPRFDAVYLGHLDYHHTDELFAQSDIVTIPSRWPEPLGAVAVEAMSAGAAVIASRVGGLGDVVVHGHNGLQATAGDVASFAAALTALLDRPDVSRRLGRQAHRDVANANVDHHIRELDDLVVAHLAGRHPPDPARRVAS